MRHDSKIHLNNSVSLLFIMFCSHDQVFEKNRSSCIVIAWCFSLFVEIVKKKCYQVHVMKLLFFLILKHASMINMLEKHGNNILKEY